MKQATTDYIMQQIDKVLDQGVDGKPDIQAFNKVRKNFGSAGDFIMMGLIASRAVERGKKNGNGNGKKAAAAG